MEMNVKIVRMTADDVDEVFRLEELIHPEHHWTKDSFYSEIANKLAVYYCARNDDNKLIAYIGFWKIIEEAHITTFATHPEYRRLQLGQALLVQMFSDCYKNMIKYVTLEVRESNIPAISLYEKFLFESIGVRKNYYQDNGENALIMFTQNIWYDKFKNRFEELKQNINRIQVVYAE